jgi:Cu2+-exporting ATPase
VTSERKVVHDHHHEDAHTHGHGAHADHLVQFRDRFWWTLLLTIPIVVTSDMVMEWFNYSLQFRGRTLVGPVLGSVVFVWGGWPFLIGGWHERWRATAR